MRTDRNSVYTNGGMDLVKLVDRACL